MVVAVVMMTAGQGAIQHVKVVMVIVILITQDSTYSSIFRAGNGKQYTNLLNYLNNIVNYKFDSQYIYCNLHS